MMRILGIDPGSRRTGFGIIDVTDKSQRYVTSGCIKTNDGHDSSRLKQIFDGVCQIVQEYMPHAAAIERVFVHKNALSALKLGQARGVAMVAMANYDLIANEYAPRQIKQAVVGYGAAGKQQVQHMVQSLLQLSGLPQEDASDALAIAICHANLIHATRNITQ